jgi:hypothetical protein
MRVEHEEQLEVSRDQNQALRRVLIICCKPKMLKRAI